MNFEQKRKRHSASKRWEKCAAKNYLSTEESSSLMKFNSWYFVTGDQLMAIAKAACILLLVSFPNLPNMLAGLLISPDRRALWFVDRCLGALHTMGQRFLYQERREAEEIRFISPLNRGCVVSRLIHSLSSLIHLHSSIAQNVIGQQLLRISGGHSCTLPANTGRNTSKVDQ